MADYPSDPRRFSGKEMALILKLASEMEQRELGGGRSLAEIQQIAAEAGIDPQLVVRAADSLAVRRSTTSSRLLGAPTSASFERSVPGKASLEELAALLGTIRQGMGQEGEATQVLGALEWRHSEPLGASAFVQVAPRQGRTLIQVTGRYGDSAGWRYATAAILALMVSAVVGTEVEAALVIELGLIGGVWAAAYAGARAIWSRVGRGRERQLREVADALAAQVAGMFREDVGSDRQEVG